MEETSLATEETPDFASLGLPEPLLRALRDVGYETPTPIQAAGIPALLEGRDLLGAAQTGTGKTAAFVLPMLARLDPREGHPQLLVLTPTRELAVQVAEATKTYARHLEGVRILPVYGGQGMGHQLRQLRRGAQVVVGTPGRVLDHLRRGTLDLGGLVGLVLDEADEMLRMGFLEEVTAILDATPETRQTALFSATMPAAIRKVSGRYLRDPAEVRIRARTATVAAVRQRAWQVRGASKLDALARILEAEEFDGVLVFARTKNATTELAERLEARGYAAAALNGDMNQPARERTVERLKEGAIDILVATDVAARGLDVDRITHVVNYDIPFDTESYVHRIGRTGRAGRAGEAILFVRPRERRMLHAIEKATRQKIERMELPTRADVSARRVERFKQELGRALGDPDLPRFRELVEDLREERDVDLETLAAALVAMAQRERPLDLGAEPEAPSVVEVALGEDGNPKLGTYSIQVGKRHGLLPGNLVAALTREAGLEAGWIGRIDLGKETSFVELPADLPEEVLGAIAEIQIRGRPLAIRPARAGAGRPRRGPPPRDRGRGHRNHRGRKAGHRKGPRRGGEAGRPGKPGKSGKPGKGKPKGKARTGPRED